MLLPGSVITMHGPVRWFLGNSFEKLNIDVLTIDPPKEKELKEQVFLKKY